MKKFVPLVLWTMPLIAVMSGCGSGAADPLTENARLEFFPGLVIGWAKNRLRDDGAKAD